jgi:hypothetical protein
MREKGSSSPQAPDLATENFVAAAERLKRCEFLTSISANPPRRKIQDLLAADCLRGSSAEAAEPSRVAADAKGPRSVGRRAGEPLLLVAPTMISVKRVMNR